MQRFCLLLMFIIFVNALSAEPPFFYFKEYTPQQVKLHTGIVKAYQDHLGYMWFCGFDGVTRYNGHEFESIFDLYPESKKIPIKSFRSIHVDHDNTIWLSSLGSGLMQITESGALTDFDTLIVDQGRLPSRSIFDVIPAKDEVWMLGDFGLKVYKKENGKYTSIEISQIPDPKKVTSITSFDGSTIWINDNKAIYRYDVQSKKFVAFPEFARSKVNQDHKGEIWINKRANGNILYKFDKKSSSFHIADKQPFATINETLNLCWDTQNRVWAAAFNTQIYAGDMNTGELILSQNHQHNLKFPQFSRKPILDQSGAIWIINGSAYMHPFSYGLKPIQFEATKEKIINNFHIDDDHVVMGVQGEGLVVIDRKRNQAKTYTPDNSDLAKGLISMVSKVDNGLYAVGMVDYLQFFNIHVQMYCLIA